MATKQYKVTLTDEVVDYLRKEDSRGRLSEGIDRLVQRVRTQASYAPTKPREKTFDLPQEGDEPAKPKIDGRHAIRISREAREEAVKQAHIKACQLHNMREHGFEPWDRNGNPAKWHPDITQAEIDEARAYSDRQAAEHNARMKRGEDTYKQALAEGVDKQKAIQMGYAAANLDEHGQAEPPKPAPTLSDMWKDNPWPEEELEEGEIYTPDE